jgi:predicted Zn-dependent protease
MPLPSSQVPMHMRFLPDQDPLLPSVHGYGQCACHPHGPRGPSRRLFTGLALAGAASPLLAREGVEVGSTSKFAKLAPADQVEAAGAQQYAQMMGQANQQKALVPAKHPQVERLRYIGQRLLPFAPEWNPRAERWKWEVNLIASKQLNAFCMPGGKIAFFTGILVQLQLDDNEVAAIMGHEIAHALREHARERMGKQMASRLGAGLLSSLLGLGNVGETVLGMSAQLLSMKWGREDESEADLVGMDLAARAGYDPKAGVSLWQKMAGVNKNAPPQWMSTHPSGPTRIKDIEATLPRVADIYARASKPDRRFAVATDKD